MAEEKQNVTIACNATGQPQPSITWSKAFGSLPKEKAAVKNGALTIYNLTKNDGGIYMCKAENILGRDTSTVLVVVFSPLRFKVRPPHEVSSLVWLQCPSALFGRERSETNSILEKRGQAFTSR